MEAKVENPKVTLKKELNLINGITIIVGSVIGSGIFLTPKAVLEFSGESVGISIMLWITSGVISMLGALCYAELGTTIHQSGGEYAYIKVVFGNLAAFLQLWINLIIIRPTAQAIVAMTFAVYALQPFYPSCTPPTFIIQLLAACCIALLTWINITKVSLAARIQDLFTAAKLVALAIIIITGIVLLFKGRTENFEDFFKYEKPISPGQISLALYSGLFAYGGWNLPLAIYVSMFLVTMLYVLVNVAYFTLLSPIEVLSSDAVAVVFGDRIYNSFSWIIPVFVSLSCFGGVNGLLFTSGRLNFVGARDGMLPPLLAMIHINRLTPMPAIFLTAFFSFLMLLLPDMFVLINYFSFVQWLSVGASIIALITLRKTRPDLYRPIRLPLVVPISFLFICIFLLLVPFLTKPKELIVGFAFVLTGIPVYFVGIVWEKKPKVLMRLYQLGTRFCQKLMYVVTPE